MGSQVPTATRRPRCHLRSVTQNLRNRGRTRMAAVTKFLDVMQMELMISMGMAEG